MSVILAEDIGGWLLAGGVLARGVVSSLLALLALIPASRGKRSIAITLLTPSLIVSTGVTIWLVTQFIGNHRHGIDVAIGSDLIGPWIFMAGPSFLTGVIAILVTWAKSGQRPLSPTRPM